MNYYVAPLHEWSPTIKIKFSLIILSSGPRDVVLKGTNKSHLSVSGLHVDPAQGSPTIFIFNLTVTDYANLSSSDTAQLEYRKGHILCNTCHIT